MLVQKPPDKVKVKWEDLLPFQFLEFLQEINAPALHTFEQGKNYDDELCGMNMWITNWGR